MAHSSQSQAKILVFLAILALSALTMIWLFWRYPLKHIDCHGRGPGRALRVGAARALRRDRQRRPQWTRASTALEATMCAARPAPMPGSLSDAKAAENGAEQILAGELAGDLAERALREPQILGKQFKGLVPAQHLGGALHQSLGAPQGVEMAAAGREALRTPNRGIPRSLSSGRAADRGPRRSWRSRKSRWPRRRVACAAAPVRSILLNTRVSGTSGGNSSSSAASPCRRSLADAAGILHVEHAVRLAHLGSGAAHALLFRLIARGPQARGVDQIQRQPVELQMLAQHVARGARRGRDDGDVIAHQPIEQARLSGVRLAGDHHGQPLPQQAPLASRGDDRIEAAEHLRRVSRRWPAPDRKSTSSSGKSIAAST